MFASTFFGKLKAFKDVIYEQIGSLGCHRHELGSILTEEWLYHI